MTPAELLAQADRLLTAVVPGTRGRWPRACAWLTRLALEQALDEYWSRALPEAVNCGVRPQLLMLPQYAGPSTAAQAAEAWYGLARASHHHAYDLAPTAAELRRWHDLVRAVVAQLAAEPKRPVLRETGGAAETESHDAHETGESPGPVAVVQTPAQ